MAERSYNGRVINTNPTMTGTGSTTTVNSWIGDASQGWGVVQTSSGTITECTYTTYLTEDCIKLSVTGMNRSGGATGQLGISNIASYPGPTMSLSVLAGIAENVKPGKQYKLTNRYFISALAADTGSMRFVVSRTWYNSNGTRLAPTDSTPDTTVSTSWETYEETITAPVNAAYLVIRANLLPNTDPTTNGSGTVYVSDFRVTEVLPARTTATSRTTATNRVAVRDMGTALRMTATSNYVSRTAFPHIVSGQAMWFSFWFMPQGDEGVLFSNKVDLNETDKNFCCGYRLSTKRLEGAFFTAGTPNVYKGRFGSRPLVDNVWYHFTIVYDGTPLNEGTNGVKLYMNGVLQPPNSQNFGGAGTGNNLFAIGQNTSLGGTTLRCLIDEFRTGSVNLTAEQIANLYLYGAVPRTGLVAEYLFDEATGTTAIDSSGNGNDGTITGATYTTDVPLEERGNI